MAKISRKHDAAMGETGAGIDNVAQIDRSVTTAFTTKWGAYLYTHTSSGYSYSP